MARTLQQRPLQLSLLLFLASVSVHVVHAFVPPRAGTDLAETYEPVHVYRQRNNITFDYRPKHLHPETCRYLSAEECRNADASMQRHQQRHRDLQKKVAEHRVRQRRRRQRELRDEEETQQPKDTQQGLRGSRVEDVKLTMDNQDDTDDNEEDDVSEEELNEYHMTEFRKILAELTQHIDQNTGLWDMPTTEEEREELEEFLKEHDDTHPEYRYKDNSTNRSLQRTEPAQHTGRNPRVGTFRVLVLLLRFSDHQARKLPNRYEYQILWNLRIRRWIIQNSYGKYDAFFEVRPWRTSDNTEKHYSFGQSGRVAAFQESYWPLLNALDGDASWDWSKFDFDDNGLLDNLIVLHSGYGAEEGGQDCTNGREYLDRIWSHAFSDSQGWRNAAGTYGVEGYMIASALDRTCDSNPAKMGVMTHEYLHTLYLIDLYDYTFQGKGVGNFDIMAYPYGFGNDGYMPVSLSAWAKIAIEWLTCQDVSSSNSYVLEPAAITPACIKILLQEGFGGNEEYFLLENRQQVGFDVEFWQSGVMIYHVDDAADEQYNRGYPGQGGWPGNGNHYQIAVMQADKNYDLEQGNNLGDEGDIYTSGTKIGPNLDGNTFPNTDMYQSGYILRSGLTIEVGELQGTNYKLNINFQGRSGAEEEIEKPATDLTDVFAAPKKEPSEESQAQFRTPDADDYRMSGKIPQLPWYEEQQQQQVQQQAASGGSMPILVLDEVELQRSSASSAPSGRVLGFVAVVGTICMLMALL